MISDATTTEADNRDWTPRHEQGPRVAKESQGSISSASFVQPI
jgi:hypothetical protein